MWRRPPQPLQPFGSAVMPPNYSENQTINEISAAANLDGDDLGLGQEWCGRHNVGGPGLFSCDLLTALLGHVTRHDGS
jgi:hypothetical protein